MDWTQIGATGGLVIVALGLIEVIKGILTKRVNGNPADRGKGGGVTKLDCLRTQNELFEKIRNELKEIGKEFKNSIKEHESFHHREDTGVGRIPTNPGQG